MKNVAMGIAMTIIGMMLTVLLMHAMTVTAEHQREAYGMYVESTND